LDTAQKTQSSLELPVIGFHPVVAYCSVRCHAAGANSSSTFGYTAPDP
jgi:hypothetical protein